jgi:hypothetical protein
MADKLPMIRHDLIVSFQLKFWPVSTIVTFALLTTAPVGSDQ